MSLRIWIGLAVGVVIGIAAVAVAIMAAGAGHGTYIPAIAMFPFAMILTPLTDSISPIAMVVALVQFPLYGWLIARASARGNGSRVVAVIALAHGVVAVAAYGLIRTTADFL